MHLDLFALGDAFVVEELGDLFAVVSGQLDELLAGLLVLFLSAVAVEGLVSGGYLFEVLEDLVVVVDVVVESADDGFDLFALLRGGDVCSAGPTDDLVGGVGVVDDEDVFFGFVHARNIY